MTKKANAPGKATKRTRSNGDEWTMLVYFAGDNNLTAEMVWGLQELKKTSAFLRLSEKSVNVVAHFDPGGLRSRRYDLAIAKPNGTGKPARLLSGDGNLDATAVYTRRFVDAEVEARDGLARLGRPGRRLSAFVLSQIRQLKETFAQRYIVVLSGHGSGAEGDFLMDNDPTTSLSIPELRIILREMRRKHYRLSRGNPRRDPWNEDNEHRIEILGMDSCLMSNVEVCYEVRKSVNYLVASEGFVENTGWPYHRVVQALLDKNSPRAKVKSEPLAVAKQIAKSYARFYRDYEITGVSTDIAVCNLNAFRQDSDRSGEAPNLVGEIKKLADFLIPRLEACHARTLLEIASNGARNTSGRLHKLASAIGREIDPGLKDSLKKGSHKAKRILGEPSSLKNGETSGSAEQVLLELMQSHNGFHKYDEEQIAEIARDVVEKDKISPELALAYVRAVRELDTGVKAALESIEELDLNGDARAKTGRELLLKFHHVRQLAELRQLGKKFKKPDENARFLNALVAARWNAQSFKGGVYVDLYDFCECLERSGIPDLHDLRPLKTKLEEAVTFSTTTGPDFQHAHGLSVFFPVKAEDYTPEYMNLQFAQATGWGRLVRAYLEATRRMRREEDKFWFGKEYIRRYTPPEADPLRRDQIEAGILGVVETAVGRGGAASKPGRGGDPNSARGGDPNSARGGDPNSARGGDPNSARGGDPNSARGGDPNSARGKRLSMVFGNPPDGFYRRRISQT